MVGAPKAKAQKTEERHRPPKRPVIVRVFRTLKRRYHASKRRHQPSHHTNEGMMARWTRNVGLFTLALVFVGIFTAVIFKWQLDVMQGQLAVMKQQMVAKLNMSTKTDIDANQWKLTPVWKNTGQSDARNVVAWDKIRLFKRDEAEHFDFLKWPVDRDKVVKLTIPPEGSFSQQTLTATQDDAQAYLSGSSVVIIWGYIEWNDVFDDTPLHSRNWCHEMIFDKAFQGYRATDPTYYKSECNQAK